MRFSKSYHQDIAVKIIFTPQEEAHLQHKFFYNKKTENAKYKVFLVIFLKNIKNIEKKTIRAFVSLKLYLVINV